VILGEPEGVGELMGEIRGAGGVVTKTELHEPLSDAQVAAIRSALEQAGA
jgi:ethanolamine utilization protein EutP (predicted NTPase)